MTWGECAGLALAIVVLISLQVAAYMVPFYSLRAVMMRAGQDNFGAGVVVTVAAWIIGDLIGKLLICGLDKVSQKSGEPAELG